MYSSESDISVARRENNPRLWSAIIVPGKTMSPSGSMSSGHYQSLGAVCGTRSSVLRVRGAPPLYAGLLLCRSSQRYCCVDSR